MTNPNPDHTDSALSELLELAISIDNTRIHECTKCLDLALEANNLKVAELAKLPFHLNLLETFADGKLRETAHSRFLWKLLLIPSIMDSFMQEFFKDSSRIGSHGKINYPDRYHMDISIEAPSDFFIIENKINDAPEQCGQIYRYVHHALRTYRPENIHVLYLNSSTHDFPSDFSLTKDGKGILSIPKEVNLKVISYKDEIVAWLEQVYLSTSESEPYLKSAIFQYIDYLKEFFHINPRHKEMNHKIESLIKERLFTENMTTVEKLNAISDIKTQISDLKTHLETLEKKQETERFQEWFNELIEQYPLDEYDWKRDNPTDIHISFNYHNNSLAACLTIDEGLCWGIRCENKTMPAKWAKELQSQVQVYLPKVQSTDWWPAWDYTSYENGLNRFRTLLECVFAIEDPID